MTPPEISGGVFLHGTWIFSSDFDMLRIEKIREEKAG
jgi:hypothetical protein